MDKVKQTVCESSEAFIKRLSDESEANDLDFYEFSDIDIEGTYDPVSYTHLTLPTIYSV